MSLNNLLKLAESFYSLALKAEKLPKNSNSLSTILSNVSKLDNFNSRIKYCEKNLKHLSSGSSRIVYLTSNNNVIKLAKNEKGIDQNKSEAKLKTKSKYFNLVSNYDKNFLWIQVPYIDKITENDFKEITSINFKDFGKCIMYGLKKIEENPDIKKPKHFDEISQNSLYKEVVEVGKKYNLLPGDLDRISSWGAKNNIPVVIDCGLTKETYKKHYDSSKSNS